ncbi:MAG TPA: monovalent cation/H(+) antiporter subunit G [Clostridia bacterium]|nr:monovalent cation/H(+) antiporter subunit G [Clostridia bacterium]
MLIRSIFAGVLIVAGVLVACVAVLGVFRFRYVLNRMHAAALLDTLGLLLVLTGLIVLLGLSWQSAKLLLIIVFMWLASPVMSHLIARAEVMTHAHLSDECEVTPDDDGI